MPDGTDDSSHDGQDDDEATRPGAEEEMGAAVDEALELELKRQKARFIQQILSIDRKEGVGRIHERWDDSFADDADPDRPRDPEG